MYHIIFNTSCGIFHTSNILDFCGYCYPSQIYHFSDSALPCRPRVLPSTLFEVSLGWLFLGWPVAPVLCLSALAAGVRRLVLFSPGAWGVLWALNGTRQS